MGLMDAFNPEATTELKVGELYRMLQQAAENESTAKFLMIYKGSCYRRKGRRRERPDHNFH